MVLPYVALGFGAVALANLFFAFRNLAGDPGYALLLFMGAVGCALVAGALVDPVAAKLGRLAAGGALLATAGVLRVLVNVARADWSPYFPLLLTVAVASVLLAAAAVGWWRLPTWEVRARLQRIRTSAWLLAAAYVAYLTMNVVQGSFGPMEGVFAFAAVGAGSAAWALR